MSKDEYFDSSKYDKSPKLFITNLPPDMPEDQLKTDLQPLFEKYGTIKCINVKKHKSGQYSYCFLEFERPQDAIRAIEQMDQRIVHDRPMKVRQDRQGDGCFNCKKTGHFAKQCPMRDNGNRASDERYRRRSRDRNNQGYDPYRSSRRERQRRSRSRSSQYRERTQKKHRRQRSRSRDYSPYDQYRRDHHRRRYRHSKSPRSRSPSDSYDQRDRDRDRDRERERERERDRHYRRRETQRQPRRQTRQYRRSRSSSYDQRRSGR